MKIKPVPALAVVICLFLGSCIDGKKKNSGETHITEDFVKVNVPGEYTISVPKSMQKTTALNSDASLQYQNINQEIYTIIIDEPKQEFVDAADELGYEDRSSIDLYRDIQLKRLAQRMNITHQTAPKEMIISGLKAVSVEIDAKVDNIEEELSYFLTFVEGKEKIYMIMPWTLKRKKQDFRDTFLTIVKSLELYD